MGERQCSAGTEATFCLPQWSILKISLTKLRCTREERSQIRMHSLPQSIAFACNFRTYIVRISLIIWLKQNDDVSWFRNTQARFQNEIALIAIVKI